MHAKMFSIKKNVTYTFQSNCAEGLHFSAFHYKLYSHCFYTVAMELLVQFWPICSLFFVSILGVSILGSINIVCFLFHARTIFK